MLNHTDNLQLGERSTILICALNRKTRRDLFQLPRPLSEKSQKQLLLATQESLLEGVCYRLAFVSRLNSRVLSLIIRRLSRRSSMRRLEEIRLAPIDRRARCAASTACNIVPTFSDSRTLDIGVTSNVNPGILDNSRTAALT